MPSILSQESYHGFLLSNEGKLIWSWCSLPDSSAASIAAMLCSVYEVSKEVDDDISTLHCNGAHVGFASKGGLLAVVRAPDHESRFHVIAAARLILESVIFHYTRQILRSTTYKTQFFINTISPSFQTMSAMLRAAHLSPAFAMDSIPVLPLPRTAAAGARSALRKFPDMVASVAADRDSAPTVCMTLLVAGEEIAAWAGPASRLLKRPTRIRAADALMLTSWARCLPLDVDGKAWGSVCLPSFSDSGTLHGFVKYCGSACRGPRRAALAAASAPYETQPSEAIQRVALTPHVARAEAELSSSGAALLPGGRPGEAPAESAFGHSNMAAKRTIRDASQRTMETVMEMYGAEPALGSSATPKPILLGESTPMRAGFSDSESEGSAPDRTPVARVASLGAVNSEVRRSWPSGTSASSPARTCSCSTSSSSARAPDGAHPLAASEALLDDVLIVTVYTGGMGFSLDVMHAATDALRTSLASSHVLGDISKLVGEDGLSAARVGTRSSLAAHVHREFATSPRHAVVLNCSQKQHFTFAWPEPDMAASERRYMLARYTALWARMRSHDGARSSVLDAASDPGQWTWVAHRHADWVALTQWPSLGAAPEHILMSCKRWCEAAQEALAHFTITLA